MRIGELAKQSGLTTKTLRFYEQAGVLPPPARTAAGYRDFNENALARLAFVRAGQAAGLTLAEIRTVMAVREDQGPPCVHVTTLLARHATALDERIAELEATRTEVRRLQDRAATLNASDCQEDGVCHIIPSS